MAFSVTEKEDFNKFFYKFSTIPAFQLERIHFPISMTYLDYPPPKDGVPAFDLEEMEKKITQTDWKHKYFFYNREPRYRAQIFDNFDRRLRDTDERVFSWLGVENGIQVLYFFKRISGKWYLVKVEDHST